MNPRTRTMQAHAFDYIEKQYGRRFYKGQHVMALGHPGNVTGTSSAHVMVKIDGDRHANPYHPTDVEPMHTDQGA